MLVCGKLRPLDECEIEFRRKALRDAVICLGWMKISSILFYLTVGMLVAANSTGDKALLLKLFTLWIFLPQIINAVLLFYGALEEHLAILDIGLWMCLCIGIYHGILGCCGCIFFVRFGRTEVHYYLAAAYGAMAASLFMVVWYDIVMIAQYKKSLNCAHPATIQESMFGRQSSCSDY